MRNNIIPITMDYGFVGTSRDLSLREILLNIGKEVNTNRLDYHYFKMV